MIEEAQLFKKIDASKCIGKWVAISDDRLLACDRDPKLAFEKASKQTKRRILLTLVPPQKTMIL